MEGEAVQQDPGLALLWQEMPEKKEAGRKGTTWWSLGNTPTCWPVSEVRIVVSSSVEPMLGIQLEKF